MSLAKTNRRLAARYLALARDDRLTRRVLQEYDRTTELVLLVTGHDRLLAGRPVLAGGGVPRSLRGRPHTCSFAR
jgi:phosphoenolpyruvate carboxylase